MFKLFLISLIFVFIGCAHEECNNVPQRPPASDETAAVAPNPTPALAPVIPPDSIQIFKPTGEKQCDKSKKSGMDLEEMGATLTVKKITVYESHTQGDGKMHMQLCGSPSGTIHVFTISKKDLKSATKLGFKVFLSKGH